MQHVITVKDVLEVSGVAVLIFAVSRLRMYWK
jgi:hypothetical protein